MAINTTTVSALTVEGIRKLVGDNFKRFPLQFASYLNINQATKGTETDREVVGIGTLAPKAENAAIILTDPRVGRARNYTMSVFAGGIRVSWEADQDELYGFIRRHMASLGVAANETLNIEGAGMFNRSDSADSVPILGFDGLALLHGTHTNVDGADTLDYKDNQLAMDLSESYLQTALTQFAQVKDASGNRVMIQGSKLLYHPDNMFLVQEILRSEGKPFTADNTTNVLRGVVTPIMLNYATDSDRTLIVSGNHDLNFFMRVAPVIDSYDDKATKSMVNTVATRFTLGFGDWRHVIGSPGV